MDISRFVRVDGIKGWRFRSNDKLFACSICKQQVEPPFHICQVKGHIYCLDCVAKKNTPCDNLLREHEDFLITEIIKE